MIPTPSPPPRLILGGLSSGENRYRNLNGGIQSQKSLNSLNPGSRNNFYQTQMTLSSNQQTMRKSDRPSTATQNITTKLIPKKQSALDFVCTSEACARIKNKMKSTAFGKSGNHQQSMPHLHNKNDHQDDDGSQMFQQLQRKQVSPNMMLKKTKTAKQLKVELKIKNLLDNDPLDILRQSQEKYQAHQGNGRKLIRLQSMNSPISNNGGGNTGTHKNQDKMKNAVGQYLMKSLSKEAQGIKNTDHLKLISDFNIPLHKYNQLQNDEQRDQFILDYMVNHMHNLVKSLNELQEAKKMNDQQRVNEINKRFQNDKGLYAWLQVCTPHTSLHKKLRKALIEKFQSEEIDPYKKENKIPLGFIGETSLKNQQVLIDSSKALRSGAALQIQIEKTFDDFVKMCQFEMEQEKTTKMKRPTFWQFNKTTAETIKLINSKEVDKSKPMYLERLNIQNKKKQSKSMRPQTAKNISDLKGVMNHSQTQKQLFPKNLRPQTGNQRSSNNLQPQGQFLSPELKLHLLKKQKQAKSKQLNWNELYEKQFGEHKTEMRIRLADLSSTNSWNQVVLGSFIKLFTKKPKAVEPNLIEEYKNLEYSKVKKIVSSIPSLNECIDKEYFQSIIDKMNKKKIDQVETHISNQVILEYEKEKEKSKVARFKYLKRKADVRSSQIVDHDKKEVKVKEGKQRKSENVQMAKRFRVILKGLDNNYTQLKTRLEHETLERFHHPKKKGLPEPLDIPAEQTEAYRNKVVYEYFKDCPDKPKFQHDNQAAYFLQTTTGGPIKEIKRYQGLTQEQVARAALKIQRAIRRWRRRREEKIQKSRDEYHKQNIKTHQQTFFMTQSNKYSEDMTFTSQGNKQSLMNLTSHDSGNQGPTTNHQRTKSSVSHKDGIFSLNSSQNKFPVEKYSLVC